MSVSLYALSAKAEKTPVSLTLSERLPDVVTAPCEFKGEIQATKQADYIECHVIVQGNVQIQCERCLGTFEHPHEIDLTVAVCDAEDVAKRLMNTMEVMVANPRQFDLAALVTDELHLSLPHKHPTPESCDSEVSHYIS